tara:strand:+ start:1910 stop:4057 length:2148 start_codon:yes stop_codon:yes gene_type:complete
LSFFLRLTLFLVGATSLGLLLLLSLASSNAPSIDINYTWLLNANILLSMLMIVLTALLVRKAWIRYKKGAFGSKLIIRLVFTFGIIAIVPVTLVFIVSNQFLAKTINTWFSQSVNTALDSGYGLGRATLDAIKTDVVSQTKQVATQIETESRLDLLRTLEIFASKNQSAEISVFSSEGAILAVEGSGKELVPDVPSSALINRLKASGALVQIESPIKKQDVLQVRALAMSEYLIDWEDELIIQWIEPIPEVLVKDIEALNKGFNDYEQLLLGKEGISKMYGVTLVFTLLLAVSGALIASVLLSGWLIGPLRSLEKATKVVGLGDFRPLKTDKLNHELNDLLSSFNDMMMKLSAAQAAALDSERQLKTSSRFFEQILAGLTTGVMVFDKNWHLEQFNSSAQKILGCSLVDYLDCPISQIPIISDQEISFGDSFVNNNHQQRVDGIKEDGSKVSLIITAFLLPNVEFDNSNRIIIVFDDVSVLLEAQKSQAWADMARGLAHEIKNPLTPIILSAERLKKRLSGKLSSEEEVVLEKATRMIINQAVSLKTMVNEFQQYARLPKARPAQMDLDDVLREFLQMYSGDKRIKYERENGDTLLFNFDKDQMLQVLHNLLQNAQDAINNNPRGLIKIKTLSVKIKDQQKIQLSIEDNGPGIDQEILSRVFDPYTTTKAKGTGLGLPIVKKIIQENKATIILNNKNPNNGVVVHLLFDRITEKV